MFLPMTKTISKEMPLAEITLRRYEKPSKLSERELVRKICLSIGLLQPGDSRDVVVDVLHVLLIAKKILYGGISMVLLSTKTFFGMSGAK